MKTIKALTVVAAIAMAALGIRAQIQSINTGSGPNTGTGDSLLTAFTKVNANDAYMEGQIVALQGQVSGLQSSLSALQSQVSAIKPGIDYSQTNSFATNGAWVHVPVLTNGSTIGYLIIYTNSP